MTALVTAFARPGSKEPPCPNDLRLRLEEAVERALAALDALDNDPDFEPEEDLEHDGCEPEEDNDTSDHEASFCGITFGRGEWDGIDREANSPVFVMNQLVPA